MARRGNHPSKLKSSLYLEKQIKNATQSVQSNTLYSDTNPVVTEVQLIQIYENHQM